MFVVQNQLRPAAIQDALHDLMRDGLTRVRVCSAYLSRMGSQMLLDAIRRNAPAGGTGDVRQTVVTSLDFGLTEPAALRMWHERQAEVCVAGVAALNQGTLVPRAAFHPKFYVFDRPDGTVATLVTSANLTNRGLTTNSEVGWKVVLPDAVAADSAWYAAVQLAVPLTDDILRRYAEAHKDMRRAPATGRSANRSMADRADDMAPVPPPRSPAEPLASFGDVSIDPSQHGQMWVQSLGMSGGSHTQLELPRGAHRFFGVSMVDYEAGQVRQIAEPILVAGRRVWEGQVRWHGNNRMERINLPSANKGGFNYAQSMILFRRLTANRYELRVYPWDSDTARACMEASRQRRLLFKVGRTNTNRLVGLLD